MNVEKMRDKVYLGIERQCASLTPNPYRVQRVLNAAFMKGDMAVKRKIPVALIVAIVLMLSCAAALAAALMWQDYVPQMKQMEHEAGDYAEWPAEQRVQLAKDIISMGYIEASETTAVLDSATASAEEKAAAADQLMLKLTGLTDVKEVHSTLITYAIMGHEDDWTPEQRVWWNGIVTMYGDDGATDTLIVPSADAVSEEEAIAIAKKAVQEAYGLDDATMAMLHPVADQYVTDERPDYKRWNVQLKRYREGSSTYVEKAYTAIVDENGEVIEDLDIGEFHVKDKAAASKAREERQKAPYMQLYLRYFEEQNDFFWSWPYDVKAAYSAEMIPLVEKLESFSAEVAQTVVYRYGMPAEENIQHEQALQLARDTLSEEYKLTASEIASYSTVYEAYDITDPESPKWKFVFINRDDWYGTYYRVQSDGNSGEVILHEQFPWQGRSKDEEYDMKFY